MKSKLVSLLAPLIVILAYIYLFCFPQEASAAVIRGLYLCGKIVLPSLFPFFVLTNCIVTSGTAEQLTRKLPFLHHFHLDGDCASAMILGLLGGYPLGAKTLASCVRSRTLTDDQASSYLPLCNNGGAALFLSMIGSKLLGSMKIGALLYSIHVLCAVLLVRCFFPKTISQQHNFTHSRKPSFRFVAAVQDAAQSALTVCAFIIIFAVITQAARHISPLPIMSAGLLELSGGCHNAAASTLPSSLRAALCSFFAGWGGLCVHAQTAAILSDIRIDFRRYFALKLLHGSLAFLLTLLCFAVLPRKFLSFP